MKSAMRSISYGIIAVVVAIAVVSPGFDAVSFIVGASAGWTSLVILTEGA